MSQEIDVPLHVVEPRVMPLVRTLLRCPDFLTPVSSCEGHFPNYFAKPFHVLCRMVNVREGDPAQIDEFAARIISLCYQLGVHECNLEPEVSITLKSHPEDMWCTVRRYFRIGLISTMGDFSTKDLDSAASLVNYAVESVLKDMRIIG